MEQQQRLLVHIIQVPLVEVVQIDLTLRIPQQELLLLDHILAHQYL
jgi:hypothetical protein